MRRGKGHFGRGHERTCKDTGRFFGNGALRSLVWPWRGDQLKEGGREGCEGISEQMLAALSYRSQVCILWFEDLHPHLGLSLHPSPKCDSAQGGISSSGFARQHQNPLQEAVSSAVLVEGTRALKVVKDQAARLASLGHGNIASWETGRKKLSGAISCRV